MILSSRLSRRRLLAGAAALACASAWSGAAVAAEPIKIGLVTAMSGQSALSGESISRGLTIAIDELNAKGGILGRPVQLVRRDDEANPAKGVVAARELIHREKVAVIFGGLDTPVSLAMVPLVNQAKVPFMGPWAAGTPITVNGADPNFVFRVSAVDEIVNVGMLDYAQTTFGAEKFGMILVNNPWGESNEKGLHAALQAKGMKAVGVERFEANDVDIVPQLARLQAAGADTLFMVGNVGPSAQVVKSLDRMGWKVPVVSHWGPAGGRFGELAGPNAGNVHFVQTYSFFGPQSPTGERVLAALKAKYSDIKGPDDINPAVGVANAYDGMMLTAKAIEAAGSTDGDAIRQAFYGIRDHEGLIKTYAEPFAPGRHDALSSDDYVWTHFVGNRILPVDMPQ